MTSSSPSPEAVLHLITLHHLAQAGFASTSQAASLTLTSALEQYILLIARNSAERANIAGRSKVGVHDLVRALDDLGVDGVEDVYEFTVGLGKEVEFVGLGNGLKERVQSGLDDVGEGIGDLRLVEEEAVPNGWWDEEEEMDVDEDEEDSRPTIIRHTSPDMSWLPPLPGSESIPQTMKSTNPEMLDDAEPNPHVPISAPTQSIANRYLRPIPYTSSQHSQSHTFRDPPSDNYPKAKINPSPTTLPSLIKTYETTAREPSIAPALNQLRAQALRILQIQPGNIAPTPSFSPQTSLPAPRSTPYIPSHSDTLPYHSIPLNPHPHPSSLLNPLLHTIDSPHLPITLRDRLTSIRPPIPQNREGESLFYGEPVRGPDTAALGKARGKPEEGEEGRVRYTWDSGARGMDKWGKGQLPTGRKVVQWGEGEDTPRVPESAVGKVKLKFVTSLGGTVNGSGSGGVSNGVVGMNGLEAGQSTGGISPGVGGLKLRIGELPTPSVPPSPIVLAPNLEDMNGESSGTPLAVLNGVGSNGHPDFSLAGMTSIGPARRIALKGWKGWVPDTNGGTPHEHTSSASATSGDDDHRMNGYEGSNGEGGVNGKANGDTVNVEKAVSPSMPVVRDFADTSRDPM